MKTIIFSTKAPNAVGPYSQAIKCNGFIFCSGQIPIDPDTNELVNGDITVQTRRVLENIRAFLEDIGSSMDKIVKTTIFVKDLGDFAAVNEIYARYFERDPPARSCVEAARIPKDVLIEIEVIAEE